MKHYGFGIVARCSKQKKTPEGRPKNGRYIKQVATRMRRGHKAERQQVKLSIQKIKKGSDQWLADRGETAFDEILEVFLMVRRGS